MKIDPVVKRESGFIAWSTLLCALLLQAVFLALGKWDVSVAAGGAVGWVLAGTNFFIMSLDVQRVVESSDDANKAQMRMKLSYMWRMLVILAVVVAALLLPQIHWIPVAAAILYPRLVITARQMWERSHAKGESAPAAPSAPIPEEEEETEDGFEKMVGHFAKKIPTDYNVKPDAAPDNPDGSGKEKE